MKLSNTLTAIAVLAGASTTAAYSTQTTTTMSNVSDGNTNRRDALSKFGSAAAAFVVTSTTLGTERAAAMEDCPPKSKNCVRTTWTAPESVASKGSVTDALKEVLNTYPQEGQNGVDKGGWNFVDGEDRLEFRSDPNGKFAKFFNGGKPFVDDFRFEVEDGGVVQIRSSSRIGDSDLGVNQKRVDFLANALKAKGWSVN